MKFVFKLQSLLNWKEGLEEISRLNLAKMKAQAQRQEEELRSFLRERQEKDRFLRESMERGLSVGEYRLSKEPAEEGYLTKSRMEAEKWEIERRMAEERTRLVKLVKERKILEKLKERRYRSMVREVEKKEQKEIDERAIRGYGESGPIFRFSAEGS